MEVMTKVCRLRHPVESFGLILDMKGTSLKSIDREVDKRIFSIFQNYYPERLHKAYVRTTHLFILF